MRPFVPISVTVVAVFCLSSAPTPVQLAPTPVQGVEPCPGCKFEQDYGWECVYCADLSGHNEEQGGDNQDDPDFLPNPGQPPGQPVNGVVRTFKFTGAKSAFPGNRAVARVDNLEYLRENGVCHLQPSCSEDASCRGKITFTITALEGLGHFSDDHMYKDDAGSHTITVGGGPVTLSVEASPGCNKEHTHIEIEWAAPGWWNAWAEMWFMNFRCDICQQSDV